MASCKNCGTRTKTSQRACPNCGKTLSPGSSLSGTQPPLDPSLTSPPEAESDTEPAPAAKPAKARTKAAKPAPEPPLEEIPDVEPPDDEELELSEPTSLFSLGCEELRARICEEPELLEPGLEIYRDPQSGEPAGVEFSTEVGDIDLLAQDAEGALVVVRVAASGSGDPVGPVLEQLGWVSKHVAGDEKPVRAVVLLEPPVLDLGYAARAVADTVAFKTWRVTVAVDDVEL